MEHILQDSHAPYSQVYVQPCVYLFQSVFHNVVLFCKNMQKYISRLSVFARFNL